MDYTYFPTGPNQSFHPYGDLPPQHQHNQPGAGRMSEGEQFSNHHQPNQDIFDSNFLPYHAYQFNQHEPAAPHNDPTTAPLPQGLPPLPSPHPDPHPHTHTQPHTRSAPAPTAPNLVTEHYPNPGSIFDPSPSDVSSARTGDGSSGFVNGATSSSLVDDGGPLEENPHGRSSSEEKDTANLTPAQSRRKAQNRAAQRAFRERKERRVRDLEDELNQYKQDFSSLLEDNEGLKRQLAKAATENEILRATAHVAGPNGAGEPAHVKEETITMGPLKFSPTDYKPSTATITDSNGKNDGGETSNNKTIKSPICHRVKVDETTGGKLLDASATWDLIVSSRSDQNTSLDVQDIYERLRGKTKCDGTQPVIEEAHVKQAIQESIETARDEMVL